MSAEELRIKKPMLCPHMTGSYRFIFELPDNVAAARLAIAVGASGLIRTRTTPLLTVEEVDQALEAPDIAFRAPGR